MSTLIVMLCRAFGIVVPHPTIPNNHVFYFFMQEVIPAKHNEHSINQCVPCHTGSLASLDLTPALAAQLAGRRLRKQQAALKKIDRAAAAKKKAAAGGGGDGLAQDQDQVRS